MQCFRIVESRQLIWAYGGEKATEAHSLRLSDT